MIVAETITSVSPVEVSGWDEDELFFVEKSLLSCDDITGKQITLQHDLSDGAIIFLRLLQSNEPSSLPLAFEAHFLGCDFQGHNQFSLMPALPRYPNSRYPVN